VVVFAGVCSNVSIDAGATKPGGPSSGAGAVSTARRGDARAGRAESAVAGQSEAFRESGLDGGAKARGGGGVREPTRFRDSGIRYRGHPAGVIKSSARDSGIR
jgi:hypothetical protein